MPRFPFLRAPVLPPRRKDGRLHEIFLKLAQGQTVDAISWMGLL